MPRANAGSNLQRALGGAHGSRRIACGVARRCVPLRRKRRQAVSRRISRVHPRGLPFVSAIGTPVLEASARAPTTLPLALVAGVATAGVVLYYPVLRVGLLSDDFLLLDWASSGQILPGAWEFVRPVPLAIWAALSAVLPASAVPAALHAVNLTLHIVNAALVMRFAMILGLTRDRALAASLIFVAWR